MQDNNKINRNYEQKRLIGMINEYKGVFSKELINYLESLVELEYSVLKHGIVSTVIENKIPEFKIFRDIAIFNLKYRAFDMFKKETDKYNIECIENDCRLGDISVYGINSSKNKFKIFNFQYGKYLDVHLYSLEENSSIRSKHLEELKTKQSKLYEDVANMYNSIDKGRVSSDKWIFEQNRALLATREQIEKLENDNLLSNDFQYEVGIKKYFCDKLLKDYGLAEEDLESEERRQIELYDNSNNLQKTFVKRYPYGSVSKHVKYY